MLIQRFTAHGRASVVHAGVWTDPEGVEQPAVVKDMPYSGELAKRMIQSEMSILKEAHDGGVPVVEVLDVSQHALGGSAGLVRLAMKECDASLGSAARDALSLADIVDVGRQLAEALKRLHACGLVHLDVTPGHVLLTYNPLKACLSGFGFARHLAQEEKSTPAREGTEGFAPPEQELRPWCGGRYSDVYSLGATLQHALSSMPPAARADPTFERLLLSMQQRKPRRRPSMSSAAKTLQDLQHALSTSATVTVIMV